MDLSRFNAVLGRIRYPGFRFQVHHDVGGEVPYLQIACDQGTCNVAGEPVAWKGRKWMLSPHMTDGEIVQTAFKAVLTALEHEAREQFTYRGLSIFDPHYDIEKLVALRAEADCLKTREAA